MSRFTEFTSVEIPNQSHDLFLLKDDLVYERYYEGSGVSVVVPNGTLTNFASFPGLLKIWLDPWDRRWCLGAILHDSLWVPGSSLSQLQEATDIFYEAIQVTGTSCRLATVFAAILRVTKYFYFFRNFEK